MRFLPAFCFSSSFRLPRDIAAVALRKHVLSERLHILSRNNLSADRGLNRDVIHLTRNQFAELRRDLAGRGVGRLSGE